MSWYEVEISVTRKTVIRTHAESRKHAAEIAQDMVSHWDTYVGSEVINIKKVQEDRHERSEAA